MAHMSTGGRNGPRVLTRLAIALSFLFVSALAGQHTHTDTAESAAACAVCASTHQAPVSTLPPAEPIAAPIFAALEAPAFDHRELRPADGSTRRTRAPPTRPV